MSESPTILIDGSYFIFYRFYALVTWWKNAKPEQDIKEPAENEEFCKKFIELFPKKLKEIKKRLKMPNAEIIVAKDCSRKKIWRNYYFQLLNLEDKALIEKCLSQEYNEFKKFMDSNDKTKSEYKSGRNIKYDCSKFFELSYKNELFLKEANKIIEYNELEADDCIALYRKFYPNKNIIIIANDHDYLQLLDDSCKLFNLKFKEITTEDKKISLELKCILGDKSDNIKGLFKRCGKKTALKLIEDQELFKKRCKNENKEVDYLLNKRLIDFNQIPTSLKEQFNDYLCTSDKR